jgi:hypothetical protein
MKNFIINLFDEISIVKWNFKFYTKLILDSEFKRHMNSNKKFRNSNQSDRCFIVGNGPSLQKMNLKLLNAEIVFTVNNIMHDKEIYNALNSDYHVIIDPEYFILNEEIPEEKATINLLKQVNYSYKKPVVITNYEGRLAFIRYKLDSYLDLHYLFSHRNIGNGFSSIIRMNKNFPSSQNVIQCALFSAIDMGYKEIYLLGCDMTSVFSAFEYSDEGDRKIAMDKHAYQYTDAEIALMLKGCKKYDNEFILDEYARNFRIFKKIRSYAGRNEINIYNAGIGGGLDVFERISFDSLFQ